MKKELAFAGILILGSVLTVGADHLIGMSYKDISVFTQIAHKIVYMAWGGIFMGFIKSRRG